MRNLSAFGGEMYNIFLFLHVITAFIIAYVALHGTFTGVFRMPSTQLRVNMILLPTMSILSLVTGSLIIEKVNYSHSALWIVLTYPLFASLILINEGFIRRKQRIAKREGTEEINVFIEYAIMTLIVVMLTFLMIFKPS